MLSCWETPSIYSWDNWIEHCWNDYVDSHNENRTVLTLLQRKLLWEELIKTDSDDDAHTILWNLNASVTQVMHAWQIVYDYFLEPENWSNDNADSAVFAKWYKKYLLTLKENNWLDSSQRIAIMIQKNYRPTKSRLMVGPDAGYTPYQKQWLTHNDIQIERFSLKDDPYVCQECLEYESFEQEITACAHWAKEQLKQDSSLSIAIVIPESTRNFEKINSIFRSVFVPDCHLDADEQDCFDLSIANSLSRSPLIDSAVNCLQLCQTRFDYQVFSHFLRNAYLSDYKATQHAFALLDVELRKRVATQETLAGLIYHINILNVNEPGIYRQLINRLDALSNYLDSIENKQSPANWCNHFSYALRVLGWPEQENLNLKEQSDLMCWDQLLAKFCTSGMVIKKITLKHALSVLFSLLSNSNSPANHNASVKLITLDDVTEARFDCAWVTGFNDDVLPEKVKLNPLIPFAVQRKNKTAFATNESCNEQAAIKFDSLIQLSSQTRFSYFKRDEHSNYRVSPYLENFKIRVPDDHCVSGFVKSQCLVLEEYEDAQGLPVKAESVTGGVYLLKSQAACPFQAYAAFRLGASKLELPQPGITADIRGRLVHEVLFEIWSVLHSQKALLALCEEDLASMVHKHIDSAMLNLKTDQQPFAQIEKQRLFNLVMQWMEHEKNRGPFEVHELEYSTKVDLDALNLTIKIDRIDKLDDEQWLIIDYKTGRSNHADWLGERLVDPQIPVYIHALNETARAAAFVNLKEMKFDGISEDDLNIPGVRQVENSNMGQLKNFKSFSDVIRHWHISLNVLIEEFIHGCADVKPLNPGQQCAYCARQTLCRINQHSSAQSQND